VTLSINDWLDKHRRKTAAILDTHRTLMQPVPPAADGACCGEALCDCAATAGAQARALSHRAALLGRGGSGQDTSALPWIGDEFEE
jgi:hypothetical protein